MISGYPVIDGKVCDNESTVASSGHTIVASESDIRSMVCTQEFVFPHASIAVQLRSIQRAHPSVNSTSVRVTSTVLQKSMAVASPSKEGDRLALHVTEVSEGQKTTGIILSSREIICVQIDQLPHMSVAVQTRVNTLGHSPEIGPS
jgi:hypothetical protein